MDEHRFVASDGLGLAWYELGGGDGHPPIVMQHGFSSSTWFEWVECGVVEAPLGTGRRVLGLDARGHGHSDKPHDPGFYGRDYMARDLMDFVASLGIEEYDLVGYSMGGGIAASVASRDPRVRRVVISGVGEGLVGGGQRAFDSRALARAFRAESDDGLSEIERNMRKGAMLRNNDLLALAAHCEAVTFPAVEVAAIRAEALVMAGDVDPLARNPGAIADRIPNGRLQIVPGDHWHSKRSPEFRAALAAFLA
jgi:pimeloyl-ACP methyl ester carboxylesterase